MEYRLYEFNVGVTASAQPDAGTPSDVNDVLTLGYAQTNLAFSRKITGTSAAPYACVAGTSIAHGLANTQQDCLMYVNTASGEVDMTANPQIAAGNKEGQLLILIGTSDTNYPKLEDGNGLSLNGECLLKNGVALTLVWDNTASVWNEVTRNML